MPEETKLIHIAGKVIHIFTKLFTSTAKKTIATPLPKLIKATHASRHNTTITPHHT
jgi:hypothetical protein